MHVAPIHWKTFSIIFEACGPCVCFCCFHTTYAQCIAISCFCCLYIVFDSTLFLIFTFVYGLHFVYFSTVFKLYVAVTLWIPAFADYTFNVVHTLRSSEFYCCFLITFGSHLAQSFLLFLHWMWLAHCRIVLLLFLYCMLCAPCSILFLLFLNLYGWLAHC